MPSSSKKQHNFMAAIAHSPSFAKKVGVPQSVGKDFNEADKGRKFSKGGDTMAGQMDPKMMAMLMAKKRAMAGAPAIGGMAPGMKKGGMAAFEKSGKDVEKKGMKEGSKADMMMDKKQMMGMKKGGMAEGGMSDTAQDKAMIKKAFKQHDAQEHKGGKGTSLKLAAGGSFRKSANGVAQRGLTKGPQVTMKKGGMC
jgi:hypothetical protein